MVEDQYPYESSTDILGPASRQELWGYQYEDTSPTIRLQLATEPLQQVQQASKQNTTYKRRYSPVAILLPILGALIGLLTITGVGEYQNLRDIPLPLILIVCGIIVLLTLKYMSSAAYARNGKLLETLMYHYHTNRGIDREEVKRVLLRK